MPPETCLLGQGNCNINQLVAEARKAMFATWWQCALLGIKEPALQSKLFATLVLPILSCAVEVWGVKRSIGEAAEVLHKGFLKSLLGNWKSTANEGCTSRLGPIFAANPLLATDLLPQDHVIGQHTPCHACNDGGV